MADQVSAVGSVTPGPVGSSSSPQEKIIVERIKIASMNKIFLNKIVTFRFIEF